MNLAEPPKPSDRSMTLLPVQKYVVPQQTQKNELRGGSVSVRKEVDSGWQSDPGLDLPVDNQLPAA
jgi:hypothetical protein